MPSVSELYAAETRRLDHRADAAQETAVTELDALRDRLLAARSGMGGMRKLLARLLKGRFGTAAVAAPERGLYLWGGVGRGKTWLMDLFFHSLPFREKQRTHFHRFMQTVHLELRGLKDGTDPLERVADRLARHARVLCFDEFFVADIADAMLLGTLLDALFRRGVTLVATSNVPPSLLYRDGLQRARFLPAIRLLETHTRVLNVDGGIDYRLRLLEHAGTWMDARDSATAARMAELFAAVAGESGEHDVTLTIEQRPIRAVRLAGDVAWFAFAQLCDGPRGQNDYIELAREYHTVFLGDVPVLGPEHENQARRFIALVDEFYDRAVKLVVAAAAPVATIYQGSRLLFEFERTRSRLVEMQSQEYLARPHRP